MPTPRRHNILPLWCWLSFNNLPYGLGFSTHKKTASGLPGARASLDAEQVTPKRVLRQQPFESAPNPSEPNTTVHRHACHPMLRPKRTVEGPFMKPCLVLLCRGCRVRGSTGLYESYPLGRGPFFYDGLPKAAMRTLSARRWQIHGSSS